MGLRTITELTHYFCSILCLHLDEMNESEQRKKTINLLFKLDSNLVPF